MSQTWSTNKKNDMRIGLLGHGYWGKILLSKLNKIPDVQVSWVCTSKESWRDKSLSVDWVLIATPNNLHYEQAEYFIQKGINVFCEKPLTTSYDESLKLFQLSEKHGVKLYVDDVFNYRKEQQKIINLRGSIKVVWNKVSDNTLFDLMYHDLYLLYPLIKNNIISLDDINFIYGQSNDKTHTINDIDFTHTDKTNDALLDMLDHLFNNKVDHEYNKQISLFANLILDKKKGYDCAQ